MRRYNALAISKPQGEHTILIKLRKKSVFVRTGIPYDKHFLDTVQRNLK
jgi:hypothetical protein